MRVAVVVSAACVMVASAGAEGFEFRCRWVERVGNVDIAIGGDGAVIDTSGSARTARIRLQFGVFDDGAGPAPAGGFLGWDLGSLVISGDAVNTRTPGRLSAFSFPPGANGTPSEDPFTTITGISAMQGPQSPMWGFDGAGNPLPQPGPTIRGVNTWVSVFELTTSATILSPNYTIVASGNLIAASAWLPIGTPIPPDPETMTPGSVSYAPVPTLPESFSCTLYVLPNCPAPGAGVVVCMAGLLAGRRRR